MSGQPVRPRSRELEIVRVLFDKHLLERAVNLAEARWDGSGEMVRLAYHWQDLSPADRRAELEKIGPEQLARFRPLAELDADLAGVLDSLEERGVLPAAIVTAPEEEPADPYLDVEPVTPAPAASEPVAAEPEAVEPPEPYQEDLQPQPDDDSGDGLLPQVVPDDPMSTEFLAQLDGVGISRQDVVQQERARREEAMRSGEELLQRVRARLDSTARRVTSNPIGSGASSPTLPAQLPASMPGQATASSVTVSEDDGEFSPPPSYWLDRLREDRVVIVEPGTSPPTDDQMVALANELGVSLHEFDISPGASRELFGGLTRSGSSVKVYPGPLARAVGEPSLTIVRGRLFPRIEARLRQGMLDIPGTKASVQLAPDARVIVIP